MGNDTRPVAQSPAFMEKDLRPGQSKASNERPMLFIYYGEDVARRSIAKLLTHDAARRIAAGIANLPDWVQRLSKGAH
jgi:hypothetical protein